ncbi:ATP-grasp domain-containing protein [Russula aff. rugulosa BPL654]|nr:ATP-grasp domain-containing protein [Russula aff. rugulosa BPL654]
MVRIVDGAGVLPIVEPSVQVLKEAAALPLMLKSRTLAYDGRENFVLRDLSHVQDALEFPNGRPLYAEKWVPFVKEIAVMVVRTAAGQTFPFTIVETVQKGNVCHLVFAPSKPRSQDCGARSRNSRKDFSTVRTGLGLCKAVLYDIGTNDNSPRFICRR